MRRDAGDSPVALDRRRIGFARGALARHRPGGETIDDVREVLEALNGLADPSRLAGMSRYGIETRSALGIRVPELRALARQLGRDHRLAGSLWETEIHEARILATMVDDPAAVTEPQMEAWVLDLDSWDLCDQLAGNLFARTPYVFDTAIAWSSREEEFVKREAFALMASATVHRKDADDARFAAFLLAIRAGSTDDRNYVKKAVSWALRQIGKRNAALHRRAIAVAREIRQIDAPSARWVASDALRELESTRVLERLSRTRR